MESQQSTMLVFAHATSSSSLSESVEVAEFMRNIGLQCLAMIGVRVIEAPALTPSRLTTQAPRAVKMLSSSREALPLRVKASLRNAAYRCSDESTIASINARGRMLWKQIHQPFDKKLEQKFGEAHPDLPEFIVNSMYGHLFARAGALIDGRIERITTSLCAIACLRSHRGLIP